MLQAFADKSRSIAPCASVILPGGTSGPVGAIVAVNFGMTFKTNRDGIVNAVCSTLVTWYDVIGLNLDTAESMTDAASTMACLQAGPNAGKAALHPRIFLGSVHLHGHRQEPILHPGARVSTSPGGERSRGIPPPHDYRAR